MQLTLVVPELIWPEPDDPYTLNDLPCAGLSTLIARSRLSRRPPQSLEATLCDAFGLSEGAAYAPFRLLGESAAQAPADARWLCADPVHLRLHQERLILADGGSLAIALDEAQAIAGELNRQFADVGTFHVATADRWYLQLAADFDVGDLSHFDVLPLSLVTGRRVGRQLPETPQARALRQLLNEVQMVLHGQAANEQREESGRPTINSLWLWGAGVLPAARASDFSSVWSEQPLARGLGRAFAVPVQAPPASAAEWLALRAGAPAGGQQLLLLDALQGTVQYEDADAYRAALLRLEEHWFAPLQKALAGGKIKRLQLHAPTAYATLAWDSGRAEQWQLWRRPRSLAATAQALARGEP
ncbi:hypothetical protein [Candidatus Accumulibacter sp. ACC003]|uniref:hypothetical protein n=1 Tax=Candidatus Accumulibacter sp. ACC003 TaxID=2823334 RepID=UPI0025C197BC|nr:hypothetical protein [Candidatus Accumulibacter sp. ACC003]